jgi:Ser/Thr protein kinase RdoA (MazF antagonist)
VLDKYSLKPPIKCHLFALSINDTYMVKTTDRNYFLRVYQYDWRSQQDIETEVELLNYLCQQEIPVSVPLKSKDGKYLQTLDAPEGTRYAVLFTEAEGKPVRMDNKQSYLYGQLVGRMHVCTDEMERTYQRFHIDLRYLIDEPLGFVEPFLAHRREDFDYLRNIGQKLKTRMRDLLPKTKPEYGICHGDLHRDNVHFDKNGDMTLFDFDCFGYGWRAYDIAVFLWNKWAGRGDFGDWSSQAAERRTRLWNSFLKGYNEERQLSDNELITTKVFVPIRHIWRLGLHTHGSERWGRNWIQDEYFDGNIEFIRKWIEYSKIFVSVQGVD